MFHNGLVLSFFLVNHKVIRKAVPRDCFYRLSFIKPLEVQTALELFFPIDILYDLSPELSHFSFQETLVDDLTLSAARTIEE